jgi:hypothetical protein
MAENFFTPTMLCRWDRGCRCWMSSVGWLRCAAIRLSVVWMSRRSFGKRVW